MFCDIVFLELPFLSGMNKPHTGIFKNCLYCKKKFYVKKYRIDTAFYCSLSCKALNTRIQIKRNCEICGNEFEHISSRANKAKYCSRKCYYKSRSLPNRGTIEFSCYHCGKKFRDSPYRKRKFCSKDCVNKGMKKKWKPIFTTVRKALIRANKINECAICGYNKYKKILGVHHIDKNKNNNELNNLQILCPTCHSIIHKKHIVH